LNSLLLSRANWGFALDPIGQFIELPIPIIWISGNLLYGGGEKQRREVGGGVEGRERNLQ